MLQNTADMIISSCVLRFCRRLIASGMDWYAQLDETGIMQQKSPRNISGAADRRQNGFSKQLLEPFCFQFQTNSSTTAENAEDSDKPTEETENQKSSTAEAPSTPGSYNGGKIILKSTKQKSDDEILDGI